MAELCRAIAGPGEEPVVLLVADEAVEDQARALVGDARNIEYVRAVYGDCWLRDTAPLLGHADDEGLGALCFDFNGWGGKFEIPGDEQVGSWLTARLGARRFESPIVLEGGALETNGRGTFITTESCVLNANRNPSLTRGAFEEAMGALLPIERWIWLDEGLAHDHTDGHVDMIARFVAEDAVLCMRPDPKAPNEDVLSSVRAALRQRGLHVVEVPAARLVCAPDGSPLPASYANFYIANQAVIVPTYDIPQDEDALRAISNAFPKRELIGLPARHLLWGGGAFHCVTQPQPISP
jgi:agmatine deiminase